MNSKSLTPEMSKGQEAGISFRERVGGVLLGLGGLGWVVAFFGGSLSPVVAGTASLILLITGLGFIWHLHKPALGLGFLFGGALGGYLGFFQPDFSYSDSGLPEWLIFFCLIFFPLGGYLLKGAFTRNQGKVFPPGLAYWSLSIGITGFYVILYWFPENLAGLIHWVLPLKKWMTGNTENGQWFLYGTVYTLLVVVMGVRFILKYHHIRYQVLRTFSVMGFQLVLAFFLPSWLEKINTEQQTTFKPFQTNYQSYWADYDSLRQLYYQKAEGKAKDAPPLEEKKSLVQLQEESFLKQAPRVGSHYFSYFWPLDYDLVWPENVGAWIGEKDEFGVTKPWAPGFSTFGWVVILFGIFLSTVGVVVLTYFFGKRWYCSWVCGCGGLAETAGDPFRHLSSKSEKAWKWEKRLIYPILGAIVLLTLLLWINAWFPFLSDSIIRPLQKSYGFIIGSVFAGVIGTGFYPLLGPRVWCRFGCPQAAILGILQKSFSRFRITTNGDQCISCGKCSTHCEMGIDVRSYAQKGQTFVRASCVGCGICSAVCPRGVLKLENGPRTQA